MLFRRRKPAAFLERLRTFVWPRRSFARSAQYFIKRVLRLSAKPHAIAAGVAAGIFASFTPFLGFHFIIAAAISWIIAGNMLASALGTAIGNPLTFPFIWVATYETGQFILSGSVSGAGNSLAIGARLRHMEFDALWGPLIKPMTIGSIPVGIAFALVAYVLTRWAVIAFREQRRRRLAERARIRARRAAEVLHSKMPSEVVVN